MEELVNKLANLQVERKSFEDRADSAVHQMGYDRIQSDDHLKKKYLKSTKVLKMFLIR